MPTYSPTRIQVPFYERQNRLLCGVHALNNLIRNSAYVADFEGVTFVGDRPSVPSTPTRINLNALCASMAARGHRLDCTPENGNYEPEVMFAATEMLGLSAELVYATTEYEYGERARVDGTPERYVVDPLVDATGKAPWGAITAYCRSRKEGGGGADNRVLGFIVNSSAGGGHWAAMASPRFDGTNPEELAFIDSLRSVIGGKGFEAQRSMPRVSASVARVLGNITQIYAIEAPPRKAAAADDGAFTISSGDSDSESGGSDAKSVDADDGPATATERSAFAVNASWRPSFSKRMPADGEDEDADLRRLASVPTLLLPKASALAAVEPSRSAAAAARPPPLILEEDDEEPSGAVHKNAAAVSAVSAAPSALAARVPSLRRMVSSSVIAREKPAPFMSARPHVSHRMTLRNAAGTSAAGVEASAVSDWEARMLPAAPALRPAKKPASPPRRAAQAPHAKASPARARKASPVKASPARARKSLSPARARKSSPVKASPTRARKASPVKASPARARKSSPVKASPARARKSPIKASPARARKASPVKASPAVSASASKASATRRRCPAGKVLNPCSGRCRNACSPFVARSTRTGRCARY